MEENLVINDKYISINNYDNKKEFNEAAQRGKIRVVSNASYAYTQNQEMSLVARDMKTRSKRERWEGSGLIYAEQKSSHGEELYGIYIFLIFILQMWDE